MADVSKINSGIITARTRTWNVRYYSKNIQARPDFGPAREIAIERMWNWSGQRWGGIVPPDVDAAIMFSHSDVIASWAARDPRPGPVPDLLAEFDQFDFKLVESELSIRIFAGDRRYYASPLAFWLAVVRLPLNEDWRNRYFSRGHTKHLDPESRLRKLHDFVAELIKPIPKTARLHETPGRSLEIVMDYGDAAVLSEYPDQYVIVWWASSA